MKIKGFTLIELLAVIVILAIIALIATPIILNIIRSTKNSAVLRGGELYLDSVEQAIVRKNLKDNFSPSSCIIKKDGNIECEGIEIELETTGSKPVYGILTLENGKITSVIQMELDGYILEKISDSKLEIKGLLNELDNKKSYLLQNTNESEESTFFNGTIKRKDVESVIFKSNKNIPNNAIGSWDVSEAQDESIIAWYTDVDNNNLYELYIGSEGVVKANPNSSNMFRNFVNVITVDTTYLDTRNVINMWGMFCNCYKLNNLYIGTFNTSQVTNMQSMFYKCNSLKELNLNNFDTSKVTIMENLFYECNSLTTLKLDSFKTNNVTNMSYMFWNCSNLEELNVSNFDTSKVVNLYATFGNCSKLTNLDLGSFNTSNVINMQSMFNGCSNLTSLNISTFNTSKVTTIASMFENCTNLSSLNLSNFDTSSVTTMAFVFNGCNNLTKIDLRQATFNNVDNYLGMLNFNSKLTEIVVKDETSKTFIEARLADAGKTGVTVTIAA